MNVVFFDRLALQQLVRDVHRRLTSRVSGDEDGEAHLALQDARQSVARPTVSCDRHLVQHTLLLGSLDDTQADIVVRTRERHHGRIAGHDREIRGVRGVPIDTTGDVRNELASAAGSDRLLETGTDGDPELIAGCTLEEPYVPAADRLDGPVGHQLPVVLGIDRHGGVVAYLR